MLKQIIVDLRVLLDEHQRPGSHFSTKRTNQVLRHLAACLHTMADKWEVDVSAPIAEINHILTTHSGAS